MRSLLDRSFAEHHSLAQQVYSDLGEQIMTCAATLSKCLGAGGKILLCGNGGSAADAQHFAAELVGRFERERKGLPAMALTANTSSLTALGNDYGFDQVFSRQVEALAKENDMLVGISTSGNSPNILAALKKARECGCPTIALTGRSGGGMKEFADLSLVVPAQRTARIQEMHILIIHLICELLEAEIER